MATRILRNDRERAYWVRFLEAQPFPMTVSHLKGASRTRSQNSTLHMWFGQVSQQTGNEMAEVKGYCKLNFGLPIMTRDNPAWIARYEPMYAPLPYQLRIQFFEIVPMTSVMTVRQMSELMDVVQRFYRQQGIDLIDPEARKYEADFNGL